MQFHVVVKETVKKQCVDGQVVVEDDTKRPRCNFMWL